MSYEENTSTRTSGFRSFASTGTPEAECVSAVVVPDRITLRVGELEVTTCEARSEYPIASKYLRVKIDGKEMAVRRVKFEADIHGVPVIEIEFYPKAK